MIYLQIHLPDGRTMRVPLRQGSLIIGRSPRASDIVIPDPRVSRVHLQVTRGAGSSLTAVDLQSAHGTIINGRALPPLLPQQWRVGEQAHIGRTLLVPTFDDGSLHDANGAEAEDTQPTGGDALMQRLEAYSQEPGGEALLETTLPFSHTASITAQASALNNRRATARPVLFACLVAVAAAEILMTFAQPLAGLGLHALVLALLWLLAARAQQSALRPLLLSLTLVPLLRLLSVGLPLAGAPVVLQIALISLPLYAALFAVTRACRWSWSALGIHQERLWLQLPVAAVGVLPGIAAYALVRPQPVIATPAPAEILVATLVLFLCSGFLEEFIFRGLLLHSLHPVMGGAGSIACTSLLYALLFTGAQSAGYLALVLVVSALFGWIAARTQSIIGVALAHGLMNVVALLILPFVMPTAG